MGIGRRWVFSAFPLIALFIFSLPVLADFPDDLRLTPTTLPAETQDTSTGIYWRQNDPGIRSSAPEPALKRPTQFARKDFELGIGVQGFTAWGHPGSDSVVFMTADLSWFIGRNFSIGLETGIAPGTLKFGTKRRDEQQNITGDNDANDDNTTYSLRMRASEGMALARYHFFTNHDLSLYVDGGLGILHASHYFPDGGRSDNWLATTGLGVDWQLTDGCYFHLGGRFARLSGGDLFARRHAGDTSDGIQYYGGFSLEW